VHLRDADRLADFGLTEIEEVPQRDDLPLAAVEAARCGGDEGSGERCVLRPLRLDELPGQLVVVAAERAEVDRDAARPHAAWHADDGGAVAEVPTDLALDAAGQIGGQRGRRDAARTVDGGDECERADLDELLDGLAASRVAVGKASHERQVLLDQPCSVV